MPPIARLKPIRIGDTFERSYTFRNAETGNPLPLNGFTITWNLQNGYDVEQAFPVTIDYSTATVTVQLTSAQTSVLKSAPSSSYLKFVGPSGSVTSRVQRTEKILKRAVQV